MDFSLIILRKWFVPHMMREAIETGTERFFCTSNRDGNASENSSWRQWRGATLRSVWLIEPSDNEFYCPTMTRERFPLIYSNHIAPFASHMQQILNLQIYFTMHIFRKNTEYSIKYIIKYIIDNVINNQYYFLWLYLCLLNNYKRVKL